MIPEKVNNLEKKKTTKFIKEEFPGELITFYEIICILNHV